MLTVWIVLCAGLALIAIVNTMLVFALVGRVRTLQETATAQAATAVDRSLPRPGRRVGPFEVSTASGERITLDSLRDRSTLVGFFITGCTSCEGIREQLVAEPPPLPVLAFVHANGDAQAARAIGDALGAVASVAYYDQKDDVVGDAFGTVQYPTLLRIQDGVVAASGRRLQDILP
jgi:hypothetical protein